MVPQGKELDNLALWQQKSKRQPKAFVSGRWWSGLIYGRSPIPTPIHHGMLLRGSLTSCPAIGRGIAINTITTK